MHKLTIAAQEVVYIIPAYRRYDTVLSVLPSAGPVVKLSPGKFYSITV